MKITSQRLIYTVGQLESNFKDEKELRDPAVCKFWLVRVVYSVYARFLCSYACWNSFQPCKLLQRHEQTWTLSLTDLSYQYYEFQGFIQCFLYISTCLFILIFHNFCLEFLILFSLSLYMCVNILYSNVEWTNVMKWLCSNVYFSIPQLSIHAAFFLISMLWPVCHCSAWQRVSKWNESTDSRHPAWVPLSSIFICV